MKMNCSLLSLVLVTASGLLSTGVVQADEALAKSRNCMACHLLEKKLVGPAYKDVAKRYAGDAGGPEVEAKLAEKIIKGGKGAWAKELGAAVPMPPNTSVKPEEAAKLVKWILGLK